MEKLREIIREAIMQHMLENEKTPGGLVDVNGEEIVTGRMVRPVDKSDKRWGRIAGVTIDLKLRIEWTDPESKHAGKTKSAVDPKSIEIY
jgi:hypothetical protein